MLWQEFAIASEDAGNICKSKYHEHGAEHLEHDVWN